MAYETDNSYSDSSEVFIDIKNKEVLDELNASSITLKVIVDYYEENSMPPEVNVHDFEDMKINGMKIEDWDKMNEENLDSNDEDDFKDYDDIEEIKEIIEDFVKDIISYRNSNLIKMMKDGEYIIK